MKPSQRPTWLCGVEVPVEGLLENAGRGLRLPLLERRDKPVEVGAAAGPQQRNRSPLRHYCPEIVAAAPDLSLRGPAVTGAKEASEAHGQRAWQGVRCPPLEIP
ncbi:hypothetical protein NDU88_001842 [Pleurodeles waltl]|uniref:Uncharacterized protein n=1 Tax=Pleurodeles waltl TaxID=8319 RepID=A0AAV7MKY1_PLEWA|nr:hypothetical protein NDU88_001842 [Pleurodeles waltl]